MKKIFFVIFNRSVFVSIFILLQIAALIVGLFVFKSYSAYFYLFFFLLSVVITVHIANLNTNPAYKLAWIIPIILLPVFGTLFYVVFGSTRISKREKASIEEARRRYYAHAKDVGDDSALLAKECPDGLIHSNYIKNSSASPPMEGTSSEYMPSGELCFENILKEIKKAEKFIFLEFFIISPGKMWNSILSVLEKKASEGVDVRLVYDDFGSIFTLPFNYPKTLEKKGIKACAFNRFVPALSPRFNYRDHRKLIVVDGNTAFTGGINLADEYINEIVRFGHWKDCGVMIKGRGVWNMTSVFLSVWDTLKGEKSRLEDFLPKEEFCRSIKGDGFIQPISDVPLDSEYCGKNVYLNIISRAKKYVYINTPYLVLDNEMITALTLAAKCGVDVRITTPHIPDKRYVWLVTRAYYDVLIDSGVKIYEYSPGFIHSKTFVSDDYIGVVGSINLDFRSLYLQYECAVVMYQTHSVAHLKEDYLKTLVSSCICMNNEEYGPNNIFTRFAGSILRLFSPMM